MKTLAQLKRDLKIGDTIEVVEIKEARYLGNDENSQFLYGEMLPVEVKEKMQGPRRITKIDTTGFYLSKDNTRGNFCGYPKASELEYIDNVFIVIEKTDEGITWQTRKYIIAL